MGRSTPELRELWKKYACKPKDMVEMPFGPDRIKVAPPTVEAWQALATVLLSHGYKIRTGDTDSYNCRKITGGTELSLHSYGIALDVNWTTNPYRDHPGVRDARFSDKGEQAERADEVKRDLADTDMTSAMIADVLAIATPAGKRVFEWGGNWQSVKDAMHFEIDLSPAELSDGIDWSTVKGGAGGPASSAPAAPFTHRVVARDGLRLREGPGTDFSIVATFPFGTSVRMLSQQGLWALVDLHGDGQADGVMSATFLEPLPT